jgi:transcription antitermination factor NusG
MWGMNMSLSSVTLASTDQANDVDARYLSQSIREPRWYAAYTCANHEKRVAAELHVRSVEHFLPLYSSVRHWKDRRVNLELPLFPGYVFVRLPLCDRLHVLQISSVVRLVGFNGLPTALPDEEMEVLRCGLSQRSHAKPHPFLTVGRRVRIIGGPFAGLEGVLKRKRNNLRVVVSVESIMRSIVVEVEEVELEAMCSSKTMPGSAERKDSHCSPKGLFT